MSFAILRIQKLKSFADVGGSLSHNYRNRETLNADDARTHLNEHALDTNEKCMTAIRDRIPEKRRKDAVLCIEHLITASPEWDGWRTAKETEFFEKSKKWLEEKYGKDNLISTTIHRDETTPHLVAYVVPLDESTGRLNAKKWLGGTRHTLTKMQTHFANHVKSLGLERGLQGSKAEHTTIKSYYAEIQKPVPTVRKIKALEIEQKIDMPKVDWMTYFGTSKKEYAEVAQLMAYENIQKQIDAYTADMNKRFVEMQTTFEKKITAEKMRADRFQNAHEKAVYELNTLKRKHEQEYAVISEYKRLFPESFEATEQLLRQDIENYHLKLEEDKNRLEQARVKQEYERERALEAARLAEQNKEKDFKANIPLKRKMRLDAHHEHFQHRLENCSSEPEKKAVRRLYEERKANLIPDPIDVMNEILKSDTCKSHFYFTACLGLFKIKSEYDFERVLKDTINCFERDVGSIYEGSTIRKVCAAALNQLDNLLMMYGSKYEDHAEILSNYLIACDEKAEQSIFPDLLEYFVTEERLEKNQVKMAAINASRDFSVKHSDGKEIEKDKGFDFKL